MPENNVKLLKPHIVAKVWGGEKLSQIKSLESLSEPVGESWEISVHADGESEINTIELSQIINQEKLPYLVKIIDTSDDLSIQVHPADEYAKAHENSLGKTECWVILDAKPGAGIYLGLKPGVTKDKLTVALQEKSDISKLLNFYPASVGQFYYVPAGTIHAIGKDIFLAEIQQNSGITYRVWDWNRVGLDGKPRALHINQALDVINFDASSNKLSNFKYREEIFNNGNNTELIAHKEFTVKMLKLADNESYFIGKNAHRYSSFLCLQGCLVSGDTQIDSYSSGIVVKGEAAIQAKGETILLLIT